MSSGKNSLTIVRKYFPNVVTVVDAKQPIQISVTQADCNTGKKLDAAHCALANACRRQRICDGALIGIATSYLIKDDVAIRFLTTESVAREVTSFDRHHDFAPGNDYTLAAVSPTRRLGEHKYYVPVSKRKERKSPRTAKAATKEAVKTSSTKERFKRHRTANVRKIGMP